MTPPIPQWLREARIAGYVNIYELCPDETRLYGTESLFGDWNGRVVVLAKDFACSRFVRERIECGDPRPYRHEPEMTTNRKLIRLAQPVLAGDDPERCGVLYGSALAGLLRDDGTNRGALPNKREALAHGRRVLCFALENLPLLRAVVCLGAEAWVCAAPLFHAPKRRDDHLASAAPHESGSISLFAGHHPVAFRTTEEQQRVWVAAGRLVSQGAAA